MSSSCSWCSWTKWEHWVNQRFYLFVSGVNQGNEEGRWVQDFLVLPQGFGSFPSVFLRARWRNLVRVECLLMIKPMVVDLEVDATLVDGFYYCWFFLFAKRIRFYWVIFTFFLKKAIHECVIWEHLHIFREVKCLQTESGLERYYLYIISSLDRHPAFLRLHLNPKKSTWLSNSAPLFPLSLKQVRETHEPGPY